MQVSAWHIYNPGSTTNRSITGLHKTEHLGLAGEESEWTRLFRKALSSVSVCLWVWSPPGTRPGDGCQPSHTQMSSLCSLIIRSDTPWVFFTTSSYPCVFWPCFARSHGVRMCVCVCVWPWPNIDSCSCQLLAQLRATFIALPLWARGRRARPAPCWATSQFSLAASPYLTHLPRWQSRGNTVMAASHSKTKRWRKSRRYVLLCKLVRMWQWGV